MKSKQSAESKQTADTLKNSKFSFQTSLPCAVLALEASKLLFVKSKQSAECKQTADHLKNSKLSYLTTLYCISVVLSQC